VGTGKAITIFNNAILNTYAGVALASNININTAGTIDVDEKTTLTYTGTLTGGGATLLKTGEGTLEVNTDYFTVNTMTVSKGTLSGTGKIAAASGVTIASGATLAPGDPTDVATSMTVNGNLTFEPGSTLEVHAAHNATNNSNHVVVSGHVTIEPGATLSVKVDFWGTSQWNYTDHFTVIEAASGDGGMFDNFYVNGLPRGVVLEEGWNGTDTEFQLKLGYDPTNGYATIPKNTHNQTEIGKSIDWFIKHWDNSIWQVIDQLSDTSFTDEQVSKLLDEIHGDLTPNALFMALKEPWRHPFHRQSLGCPIHRTSRLEQQLWGEFTARYEDVGYDNNAHSFTINRNGLAVGADLRISPRSVIGVTFQHAEPHLRQATGRVKMDDHGVGLYSVTRLTDSVDMKTFLGFSHQQYDFTRTVSLPTLPEQLRGKTDGDAMAASIELLRPMRWRQGIVVTPIAAFDFEQAQINGYRESGGVAALEYDDATLTRAMLRFGLGGDYIFANTFRLNARLQYAAQLNDREHSAIGARFANGPTDQYTADIWGSRIGRGYVNFGLGTNWKFGNRGDKLLYVHYDAKWFDRANTHIGEAGFVQRW
jgi:uncharacterized protein with beta-barrel porin domain